MIQQVVEPPYRCPHCDGDLTFDDRSWQCDGCGHVPRHGAE